MSQEPVAKDFGEGWYQGLRDFMTSVPLSEEATHEARALVLEYEAGRMIGSAAKIVERLERFKPQRGTPLETRLRLLRAYVDLENLQEVECSEYETYVDAFLALTKRKIDELRSATLRSAYGFIEMEVNVLAAIQAFYFNEDGYSETNPEEGRKRFREVVRRRVMALQPDQNDQYLAEKQARLAFMNLTKATQEVSHFCQEFPTAQFLGCCAQLIIEIQERLFGPPRLSGQLIDAASLETLANTNHVANFGSLVIRGFAMPPTPARQLARATREMQEAAGLSVSKPKRSRTEVEEEEEGHTVARRSLGRAAAPVASASPAAAPASRPAAPRTPMAATGSTEGNASGAAPSSASKPAPASATRPAPASASRPAAQSASKAVMQPILKQAPGSASRAATGTSRRVGFLPETQPESQDEPVGQTQPMAASSQESRSPGKRVRFTAEEDEAIREGVTKYGTGQWSLILADPEFGRVLRAHGRSNVNVKDRWRNINNNNA